ncbi:Fic family protein [Roseovarius sp. ZX-A-9]|uniref:Fic family protein n=1 Tax=Roseovarius sp. ZX-A-9 TaxID=3014783 RepID=UPI00232FA6DC|nr:Fic family protein [Roseovarius sp. ZX-A-9]
MAIKHEILADALQDLHGLQEQGNLVVRSGDIPPDRLKALRSAGYIQPIMKGWYHLSDPASHPGDTTPWTMSFWSFVQRYCEDRFGADWVLSPEISLGLHAGINVPPVQVLIQAIKGGNNAIGLPAGRSLYDLKVKTLPPPERRMKLENGLRVYNPAATLIQMAENCYQAHPEAVAALLGSYRDVTPLLRMVVEGSHKRPGSRMVGAFRHLGMTAQADRMAEGMRRAGIDLRIESPFTGEGIAVVPGSPPISNMLRAIWQRDRVKVSAILSAPTGAQDAAAVLEHMDDVYTHDAWHSLSIEGYRVSKGLIEKIRKGEWDPDASDTDASDRDAMAAKGYWNAFQSVRAVVETSLGSGSPVVVGAHLDEWYQDLFAPSVDAGILTPAQLIGYRNHPIFIRTANHVPPAAEKLMDAMETFFELLDEEDHPGVRAILGHWLLGYIHPYPDGNGRLARFVMNAILASSGYGWVVIRLEERKRYMQALDAASFGGDITPFAQLIEEHLQHIR